MQKSWAASCSNDCLFVLHSEHDEGCTLYKLSDCEGYRLCGHLEESGWCAAQLTASAYICKASPLNICNSFSQCRQCSLFISGADQCPSGDHNRKSAANDSRTFAKSTAASQQQPTLCSHPACQCCITGAAMTRLVPGLLPQKERCVEVYCFVSYVLLLCCCCAAAVLKFVVYLDEVNTGCSAVSVQTRNYIVTSLSIRCMSA